MVYPKIQWIQTTPKEESEYTRTFLKRLVEIKSDLQKIEQKKPINNVKFSEKLNVLEAFITIMRYSPKKIKDSTLTSLTSLNNTEDKCITCMHELVKLITKNSSLLIPTEPLSLLQRIVLSILPYINPLNEKIFSSLNDITAENIKTYLEILESHPHFLELQSLDLSNCSNLEDNNTINVLMYFLKMNPHIKEISLKNRTLPEGFSVKAVSSQQGVSATNVPPITPSSATKDTIAPINYDGKVFNINYTVSDNLLNYAKFKEWDDFEKVLKEDKDASTLFTSKSAPIKDSIFCLLHEAKKYNLAILFLKKYRIEQREDLFSNLSLIDDETLLTYLQALKQNPLFGKITHLQLRIKNQLTVKTLNNLADIFHDHTSIQQVELFSNAIDSEYSADLKLINTNFQKFRRKQIAGETKSSPTTLNKETISIQNTSGALDPGKKLPCAPKILPETLSVQLYEAARMSQWDNFANLINQHSSTLLVENVILIPLSKNSTFVYLHEANKSDLAAMFLKQYNIVEDEKIFFTASDISDDQLKIYLEALKENPHFNKIKKLSLKAQNHLTDKSLKLFLEIFATHPNIQGIDVGSNGFKEDPEVLSTLKTNFREYRRRKLPITKIAQPYPKPSSGTTKNLSEVQQLAEIPNISANHFADTADSHEVSHIKQQQIQAFTVFGSQKDSKGNPQGLVSVDTIADGSCAFNVMALSLNDLITVAPHAINTDSLAKFLQHCQQKRLIAEATIEEFQKWSQKQTLSSIQQTLSPILRSMVISTIKENLTTLGKVYDDTFLATANTYFENSGRINANSDTTFLSHPNILFKLQSIQQDPCLHSIQQKEKAIQDWWQKEGRDQYFTNLGQQRINMSSWGSEAELEIFAGLFGINVVYTKSETSFYQYPRTREWSSTVGIRAGLLTNLPLEDQQLLIKHKIAMPYWKGVALLPHLPKELEIKLSSVTAQLTENLYNQLKTLIEQRKNSPSRRDFSEAKDIPPTLKTPEVLNILVTRGIITCSNNNYLFISKTEKQNDKTIDVIDFEDIEIRLKDIPLRLATQIKNTYNEAIPCIHAKHKNDNHWEYARTRALEQHLDSSTSHMITNPPATKISSITQSSQTSSSSKESKSTTGSSKPISLEESSQKPGARKTTPTLQQMPNRIFLNPPIIYSNNIPSMSNKEYPPQTGFWPNVPTNRPTPPPNKQSGLPEKKA